MATAAGPESEAWKNLAGALGLTGVVVGQLVRAPAGVPPLAGIVERVGEGKDKHDLLIRLVQPASGVVSIAAFDCGGMVMAAISLYSYGGRADAAARRDEPLWQAWLGERFPQLGAAGGGA